jgi:hypothetical protein
LDNGNERFAISRFSHSDFDACVSDLKANLARE